MLLAKTFWYHAKLELKVRSTIWIIFKTLLPAHKGLWYLEWIKLNFSKCTGWSRKV